MRRHEHELVAITGLGFVTPIGNCAASFWDGVVSARSGARRISRFDASDLPVQIACEVSDELDPTTWTFCGTDIHRFARYALVAASQAFRDAGSPDLDGDRGAVVIGAAAGGSTEVFDDPASFDAASASLLATSMPDAASSLVAMQRGWTGPNLSLTSACASGGHAIAVGADLLRQRAADVVIAGGADATVTRYVIDGFSRLKALSTRNDDPTTACRPFDQSRDGCVVGEGAALCVLERLSDAAARNQPVYALLLGYAASADAFHLVMPSRSGDGAASCIKNALRSAGLSPSEVVCLNAHGTGTRQNDTAEAKAFYQVFGDSPPPITSIKGVTGHMMGAAGAAEAASVCLSFKNGIIPPTANFEESDPREAIDVVGTPRSFRPGPTVSTSFAFGGQNAALVLTPA